MIRLALILLLLTALPAAAGPVNLLIPLLTGSAGFTGAITLAGGFFTTVLGRLLISVGVSALSLAAAKKPPKPGIRTDQTLRGEGQAQTFILGRYATGGYRVCPDMSHGSSRGRLTYVLDLGDVPGQSLEALIVDDEYVPIDWGATPHATYGQPVTGSFAGFVYVKFYDGSQTTADAYLTGTYGAYDGRPWTSDMALRGVPFVILTFVFRENKWQGMPTVRFVCGGIPLYDPRADTTVGGSGPQRWSNRTTWVRSHNPAVQVYNILRGIPLPDGSVWGVGASAAEVPLPQAFAAMNACDAAVALAAGGSEPAFRTGFEVAVSDEPADVIEELFKGCLGRLALSAGRWIMKVGAPSLPVMTLTDDDLVVTEEQELTPYPGLEASFNAVTATYPEPVSLWEAKDAPGLTNAAWEAQDGGRRLTADLALNAVPYPDQVQRVMRAYINDERRFRRHVLPLPARFSILDPYDTVAWTSAANGYTAKLFEVEAMEEDPATMQVRVELREVDPADHAWTTANELPRTLVPPGTGAPSAFAVVSFAAAGGSVTDGALNRRPSVDLTWDGTAAEGATALKWEIRIPSGATILRGSMGDPEAGALSITAGIVASTPYEVRASLVATAETAWTAWTAVTTPATLFDSVDLLDGAVTRRGFRSRTSTTALNTSTETAVTLAVYAAIDTLIDESPGGIRNPVLIDVFLRFTTTSTAAGQIRLTLTGAASDTVIDTVRCRSFVGWRSGMDGVQQTAFVRMVYDVAGSALAAYDYFKVTAILTGTATACDIVAANVSIQQTKR